MILQIGVDPNKGGLMLSALFPTFPGHTKSSSHTHGVWMVELLGVGNYQASSGGKWQWMSRLQDCFLFASKK